MPVEYGEMPLMFDDDFLIKLWSGQVNMTPETLLNKFVTTKAPDWTYEHEWESCSLLY